MSRLLRAAFFFVVSAPDASAQIRTSPAIADSSAVQIMARLGSRTDAVWLRDVLRQSDAQYPQAKLDEIADSLIARAIDPASAQRSSEANTRAIYAVLGLLTAGASRGINGRPYTGAFDRLVRVAVCPQEAVMLGETDDGLIRKQNAPPNQRGVTLSPIVATSLAHSATVSGGAGPTPVSLLGRGTRGPNQTSPPRA